MPDSSTDSFSLLLLAGTVYTFVLLFRRGWAFWTTAPNDEDRALAGQVAFFLLTPPTVLMHELAHAGTTIWLGGRVEEINFLGFSGYVRPVGDFTETGVWALAVSGTIASLAVGLLYIAIGVWARRLPITPRYVLVIGGALQLVFALLGYPLLSILGQFGDWTIIYWFSATPALSALSLAGHILALVAFREAWRRWLKPLVTSWERGGPSLAAADANATTLEQAAATALALMESGEVTRAVGVAEAWLHRAQDSRHRGNGSAHFEGAPEGTLSEAGLLARLEFVVGAGHMGRMRFPQAVAAFHRALALVPDDDPFVERLWANVMVAYTQDHRSKEALEAYERLTPEWKEHPGVQQALDIIAVRTGKRPPAV